MFVMFLIARVSSSLRSRDIEILKEDESASAISYLIVILAKRMYAKTFSHIHNVKIHVTNVTILIQKTELCQCCGGSSVPLMLSRVLTDDEIASAKRKDSVC